MTKKQRALEIIERLKKEYPDAGCTLDYDQAWKLLVSVRLAAQCTDARVNIVVEKLYEKFPDVDALANAPVEEIEAIVKPCGLGHSKARDISACMKILRDKYQGKVPDDFDELLSLPGVGRTRSLPRWKRSCGRSFRPRKAVTSATDWYITEERYVLPEPILIAKNAVSVISVKKSVYKSWW